MSDPTQTDPTELTVMARAHARRLKSSRPVVIQPAIFRRYNAAAPDGKWEKNGPSRTVTTPRA